MAPERFQQIEELYHAARERPAEERAALLAAADPEVRREVESLLAQRAGGELRPDGRRYRVRRTRHPRGGNHGRGWQ